MLVDGLLLLLGLALILLGGEWFVSAAVRLAEFLHMPRVVIGSTLVSLATTTPELTVSIVSGLKGESGLAVGNAVGSCICNIGLILGVTAALKHVDVHPRALRTPLVALFGFGLLVFLLTSDLVLSRGQGGLLLVLGLGYFAFDFLQHSRRPRPAEVAEATALEADHAVRFAWLATKGGTALLFVLGAGLVVLGSRLLVDRAVAIAGGLGVPTIVIGLTVVAVGTSLPEFITALTSSRQDVSDLAVGNILGANIANLTLVVGTAAALHAVRMERTTQLFNFPALLVSLVLLLYVLLTENRVTRREGVLLLTAYTAYLIALVLVTVLGSAGAGISP